MRRFIVVPLVVSVGALGAHVTAASAAFPGKDGLIAFQRTLDTGRGGFADRIVTVRRNGRGLDAITSRCCRIDAAPAWSPDGDRIAFARNGRISTMNRKGKGRRRVTTGKRFDGKRFEDADPSWSPDGSQLVFFRQLGRGLTVGKGFDLVVVAANGANLRPLVTTDLDEIEPAWSPDGEWIAFTANGTGAPGLPDGVYRMRPDGSDRQLIVALKDIRAGVDWSPDGERIVFSTRAVGRPEIHTVRPDGSEMTKLTNERKPAFDAAFSPSGNRIVYTAYGTLKVMDADGGNATRLLRKSRGVGDFAPSWQPR